MSTRTEELAEERENRTSNKHQKLIIEGDFHWVLSIAPTSLLHFSMIIMKSDTRGAVTMERQRRSLTT